MSGVVPRPGLTSRATRSLLVLFVAVVLAGCGEQTVPAPASSAAGYTEARQPCAQHNPLRNAYFGDLHVHTTYSFDAHAFEVRTTPAQAYRFAQGEPVAL